MNINWLRGDGRPWSMVPRLYLFDRFLLIYLPTPQFL